MGEQLHPLQDDFFSCANLLVLRGAYSVATSQGGDQLRLAIETAAASKENLALTEKRGGRLRGEGRGASVLCVGG